MVIKTWEEIKQQGSEHYKQGGDIEPIDLYRSMGALRHFAICSIIKYAARNAGLGIPEDDPVSVEDMQKVIHYAEILKTTCGGTNDNNTTQNIV